MCPFGPHHEESNEMTRARTVLNALLTAVAGGACLACNGASSSSVAPAPAASALVKTQPLQQQSLTDSLTAFGEVTTGQVVAISFPRAVQVSRLLVVPGQRVKPGAQLATLASDPNAKLAYTQAVSAVNFARGEVTRIEELFALQLATQSQVDGSHKALQDADANLATQRQIGGDVGTATVTAPFDGVVTAVTVAEGDRIQSGAAILQLGHTDVLRVLLGIEPDESHLVRVGLPVTLSPVDDRTNTVPTSITESQGIVDPKTQLVDAVAEVRAAGATFLVPGMHVQALIKVGQHLSWAVPRAAVLTDAKGAYIFQVSGGKAHRADVTAGLESQGLVAISGSIDSHLPVVVLGNYELQEGMPVRVGP
jgi:membrane fusion protein (multidrug efflux system)